MAEQRLERLLGREPTVEEIASEAELALADAIETLQAARVSASLDQGVGVGNEQGERTLADYVAAPDTWLEDERERGLVREALDEALGHLGDVERQVVQLRYGLDGAEEMRTLSEVGRLVGLSRERVRQIEKRCLERLATILSGDGIGGASSGAAAGGAPQALGGALVC